MPPLNVGLYDIKTLLIMLSAGPPVGHVRPTDRLCELWSVAAVAFRSLSSEKKRSLSLVALFDEEKNKVPSRHIQISSEVLWGRAVASCNDPMYYEYTADSMGDDEVALVSGTKLSRSDVRLKTLKYK